MSRSSNRSSSNNCNNRNIRATIKQYYNYIYDLQYTDVDVDDDDDGDDDDDDDVDDDDDDVVRMSQLFANLIMLSSFSVFAECVFSYVWLVSCFCVLVASHTHTHIHNT